MVEVFKTNVTDHDQADRLVSEVHRTFNYCSANFDLEDCDHILRIEVLDGTLDISLLTALIAYNGFTATILEDVVYESFDAYFVH